MDFFAQQWASYRAVVGHDLMEHQAVAAATAAVLESWLAAREPGAAAPRMVDLGCGDLALLAPLLRRLPLGSYTGLDLTAQVLPLAQQALGDVPYPSQWIEGDMNPGEKVAILDDVATTGGSTIKAIDRAQSQGLQVVKAVILVDRQEGGLENIKRRVADSTAIITKDELIEEYRRSRSI